MECSNGLEQAVVLTADEAVHTVGNLPTGTTCTIIETDDGDADDATWTGGTAIPGQNGVSVTIGSSTNGAVAATNHFDEAVTTPQVLPEVIT